MLLRRLLFSVLIALGAILPSAVQAATPSALIENFHQSLLAVMRSAAQTKAAERYEQLKGPVETAFNLSFMIQIATGQKWRGASEDEKAKLTDAFKRVSAATYAARFDGFSGERFEILGEQDGPNGTRLVQTQIVRPGKDTVPITYVVRKFGEASSSENWRIIDVIVSGGISELAVRRSEYNGILAEGGIAGLIQRLNQTADRLLAS
jgi:phospholipid transport system substrate-binding protein